MLGLILESSSLKERESALNAKGREKEREGLLVSDQFVSLYCMSFLWGGDLFFISSLVLYAESINGDV